jgi:RNA polymerase sigma-70 factor, ECF subfamily
VETELEPEGTPSFPEQFAQLFDAHFPSVYRYLNRVSGDPELAADVTQETFVKLYQRGSVPDTPGAWLISVALNLFRNAASTRRRRLRLLTPARGESVLADPPPAPDQALEAGDSRKRVRLALDGMPERERSLLLLQAEGYSYREIALALELNEASVGVFLARARRAFREAYEESSDAS